MMMPTITVSFDTYKHLMFRRRDENHSFEDVIRELMGLDVAPPVPAAAPVQRKSWVQDGVELVPGTELRFPYKGTTYPATINNDGEWVQNGEIMSSPSAAARAITGNSVNGWILWEVKRPGDNDFMKLDWLRHAIPTLDQL
jgi:hypothetical protein